MASRPARHRYCRCGTHLAKDNPGRQCARCERAARDKLIASPDLPAEFWQTEQFREAFAAQHMGRVSRAYRTHPYHYAVYGPSGISQTLLGQWLGMRQPQVSRFETGPPIRDLDTLAYWVRVLRIPVELLWLSTLRYAPNRFRASLLSLGAEYAESAAWLHEDAGEPIATFWTGRALEWAHAAEADRLVVWALFRRSQQVSAERDAAQAIGLARAAHGMGSQLSDQMRAAITQQEACGLALDGDEAGCQGKLDEALEWAAADDVQGDARSGHGAFCTASYIELRRAECWLTLGRPERAVPTYETALAGLPDAYNRDRGHGLAQLAGALVAIDEPEHAAGVASEALIIASGCGSGRTLRHIQAVGGELRRHVKLPPVAELLDNLAATNQ